MRLLNVLRVRPRAGLDCTLVGVPLATLPRRALTAETDAVPAEGAGTAAGLGTARRMRCGVQKVWAIRVSAADTRWATPGPSAAAKVGNRSAQASARAHAAIATALDKPSNEGCRIMGKP